MAEMTKQELRAYFRQKRQELDPAQKAEMDTAIVDRIAASPWFRRAKAILLYAPVKGEIDLVPLLRAARRAGKQVGFPRCDAETNTMQFFALLPGQKLLPGAYGIPEPPADAPLIEADRHTLCLVPAITFSADGHRLGYGKGYYDRFLETFPGVTVGALYSAFAVRTLPAEEHDRPVQYLVTERGFRVCGKEKEKEKAKENAKRSDPLSSLQNGLGSLWERTVRFFREDTPRAMQALPASAKRPAHLPALLILGIFLLLLLSHLLETVLNRTTEYFAVILLQLLIFLAPAIVYTKLRGEKFVKRLRLRLMRREHIWFTVCMLMVMITGSLLVSILTGGIASLSGSFTLYSTFTAQFDGSFWKVLYAIVAYALLPAFGEELIFRSILCAEYERFGVPVAVTFSSLLFAMVHFSFPLFPVYAFLGALLALVLYATQSILPVMLLHLFYNVFGLFGQPYLSAFYVYAGSNEIFLFCLLVLFLLFSAFAVGEARKIYHGYATRNTSSAYAPRLERAMLLPAFLSAGRSPALLACLLLWLTPSLIYLLL